MSNLEEEVSDEIASEFENLKAIIRLELVQTDSRLSNKTKVKIGQFWLAVAEKLRSGEVTPLKVLLIAQLFNELFNFGSSRNSLNKTKFEEYLKIQNIQKITLAQVENMIFFQAGEDIWAEEKQDQPKD